MQSPRCAGYGRGVSKDSLAGGPPREPLPFGGRRWSTAIVFIGCALLAMLTLALALPNDRGQRLFLALLVCGPILLLRRWPLPVLAVTATANALVMASGNAPLPFAILLRLALYSTPSPLPRRGS